MSILRRITLLLAIALAVSWVHAQSGSGSNSGSGSGSSSSSTSTSNSGSNSQVTIDMPAGATPHQLIQAAPGPIPGMFPGGASGQIVCGMYHPAVRNLTYLSSSAITSMAEGAKLPHSVKAILVDPDTANITSYEGLIGVMQYDPLGNVVNKEDDVLAEIKIDGKPDDLNEKLIGLAAKALKKKASATQRVAIGFCFYPAEDTQTTSKGVGAVASGTNGSGQIGTSASIGYFHGESITKQEREPGITVYALGGPYNLLTLPEPKKDDGATAKPQPPSAPAQPQQPPPAPPVTTEAKVTPPPAPPVDECRHPDVAEIHFGYDCDDVFNRCTKSNESVSEWKTRSESNRAAGDTMEQWLEQHPTCKVQVEGSACHHGAADYNAGLGLRRAHAVFHLLTEDEKIKDQVFESDSNGKDNAGMGDKHSERNTEDRKVIIVVRGDDSSDPSKK